MSHSNGNHTATVIQRLVSHEHDITLFSKRFAHSLKAEVTGLDTKTGLLLLEVGSAGQDLKHYLRNGHFSFDIEARITPEGHEKEVHSFDRIPAEVHKKDADTYLIRCQLPESVFVTESRGALRIPFILGMNARVSISAYDAELTIEARVRNFSAGGCLADMSIEDSLSLYVGQTVPDLAITFPNGECLFSKGRVRHIRPFGSLGRAAVGLQFIDVSSTMSKEIFQHISECEREAASRSGLKENVTPSELFIAKRTGAAATSISKSEKSKMSRQPAMVPEVLKVAQQLKVIMMFIKNRGIFSEDALFECGDILYRLRKEQPETAALCTLILEGATRMGTSCDTVIGHFRGHIDSAGSTLGTDPGSSHRRLDPQHGEAAFNRQTDAFFESKYEPEAKSDPQNALSNPVKEALRLELGAWKGLPGHH
jgi:c-di-GMP-binding flagellar brake protein YcgR